MKQCHLCKQEKKIIESHIIPKFVYRWMKESGTGRFRQAKSFNTPIQDGIKTELLCSECDKEFGKREEWFLNNIFNGYIIRNESEFENSIKLKYFAISVLWRVLILFLFDGNKYMYVQELEDAEEEWRNYLFKNIPLKKYNKIHLIFVPEDLTIEGKLKNIYTYFHRAVDVEIAENESKSIVYSKFSRFLLIGEIAGINSTEYINTNIMNDKKIIPSKQQFLDNDIIGFMLDRASSIKSFGDLSKKQQEQNTKFYKHKLNGIIKSDYWKVFKKDL
jgi:hypothetical protein